MANFIKINNKINKFNKNILIDGDKSLSIRWALLSSQSQKKCKSSNFTLGSHEVVSCNVNGNEVHVLTKTKGMSRVSRCHIVSMHGQYKGSKNI